MMWELYDRHGTMNAYLLLFLGAISCAVASALFFLFAAVAGDRTLARMTAVAAVAGCIAALFLGRML